MVPSLRRRLVCFYCSCRSAQTRYPGIRRWQCEKCEAVNHLDENGEITDPPAIESSSQTRYAQPIQRPTSPVFEIPADSLFCKTCLKNQHIFSESLASYFPSQDAPNYADYEKQYPRFRMELEERYPQVCEECEPRVRERIRATGYAAKTDHLRRMMERTRGGKVARGQSGWKSVLVFLGGVAWCLSIAGQATWDVVALLWSELDHGDLVDEDLSLSNSECIRRAMRGSALSAGCNVLVDPVARFALVLGLLSFWWNPKLQERLSRPGGRMVGLTEYYKLQAILLIARCLAWIYLTGIPNDKLTSQTIKGIHGALLFFGALLSAMSFRAISIDYSPRVVFQEDQKPLISQKSQLGTTTVRSDRANGFIHKATPYPAQRSPNVPPFSINDLAPSPRQQHPTTYQSPYQPPTPPPEEDDDEAMDWTPSQQSTFRPATLYRPSPPAIQPTQQTPFRGHLPADVVSMEHRLRNPPNRPTFRKASESTKQNFFKTPKTASHRDYENMSDTATEYDPSIADDNTPAAVRFADPKLRLQSAQPADTGLERLLANAFRIDDGPEGVRPLKQQQIQAGLEARRSVKSVFTKWYRLPVLILLVMSFFFWMNALKPSLAAYQTHFRLVTLLIAGLASIRSLFLVLRKDNNDRSGSDLVIFMAELIISVTLVFTLGHSSAASFITANQDTLKTAGASLIAIMAVQELWMLAFDLRSKSKSDRLVGPLAVDDTPGAQPAPSPQSVNSAINREAPQMSAIAPIRKAQPFQAPAQRSTRLRTKEKSATLGNGLGSLSFGKNDRNGLDGGLDGMGSLSLRQPRESYPSRMW